MAGITGGIKDAVALPRFRDGVMEVDLPYCLRYLEAEFQFTASSGVCCHPSLVPAAAACWPPHLLYNGVDVGAADAVRARHIVLQIDLVAEVHLAGDGGEDETLLAAVRHRELDLPVESAGPQQRRVQRVGTVRRHDHLTKDDG